ncbi:MAG: DUF2461 domain-containing protein, partial [Lachnospiraceae bacterium]|nr:DUF2461 domain-containing protein [Lachnospiraceae bacterium]
EWEQIVKAEELKKHYTVQRTALKKVPAGYDRDHPQAEFLKYKSWYLEYPIGDAKLMDADQFVSRAVELFGLMKPFNDYLNRALADFQMPER